MIFTRIPSVFKTASLLEVNSKCLSIAASTTTQALQHDDIRLTNFRALEDNPLKHTSDHSSRFYTLSPKDKAQLFEHGGLTKMFEQQAKTFNETCIMIRQPSLYIIECLKAIDYTKPPINFVLYGPKGVGKSVTLAHILHYAYKDNFLLVHVPWVGNWMRRCKEVSNSEKEGYIDLNLDAAAWLTQFKHQNSHLLIDPNLQTSQEHVWSKREATPKGTPLAELIEHGVNRVKYASTCVVKLIEEIKNHSTLGHCKTLVVIDGFNAFFYPKTRILTDKKEVVHPSKVTLTEAFLNVTRHDWKNSAVVVSVDEIAIGHKDQTSFLPRYLLGKDGFEHIDPFVPVPVKEYTDKELRSCLNYYLERRWITPYPGFVEELSFMSGRNPYNLMKLCAGL